MTAEVSLLVGREREIGAIRTLLDGGEAVQAETFTRQYYRWVSPADVAERTA